LQTLSSVTAAITTSGLGLVKGTGAPVEGLTTTGATASNREPDVVPQGTGPPM
jgi:hypothetical protein